MATIIPPATLPNMSLHRSRRVLLEDGPPRAAAILVAPDGTIARVLDSTEPAPENCVVHDHGDLVVMAGLVDSHVHLNQPGRTDWEGFWSGTRAAAAGGVTTLADMPLNSIPPTTCAAHLRAKREAATGQCHVDLAFWGGLVPDNLADLLGLVAEGVVGFKCFLVESGVPEFPAVDEHVASEALRLLRDTACPLAFHAEVELSDHASSQEREKDASLYSSFLASRPDEMEKRAVELVVRLCENNRSRCHVVHVSSASTLPAIGAARARGVPLSAETCPHYLCLEAETVPRGATHFKCCPPVRSARNKDQLWDAVRQGLLQSVVSDHSPCPPHLKQSASGDFQSAWGGISSLQLGLPCIWSAGRERGLNLEDLTRLMSGAPAELCGLQHCKGRLAVGYDADLVIWNPEEQFEVTEGLLHQRHKVTPYMGAKLHGKVHRTVLRGQIVYDEGQFSAPKGQFLRAHHNQETGDVKKTD